MQVVYVFVCYILSSYSFLVSDSMGFPEPSKRSWRGREGSALSRPCVCVYHRMLEAALAGSSVSYMYIGVVFANRLPKSSSTLLPICTATYSYRYQANVCQRLFRCLDLRFSLALVVFGAFDIRHLLRCGFSLTWLVFWFLGKEQLTANRIVPAMPSFLPAFEDPLRGARRQTIHLSTTYFDVFYCCVRVCGWELDVGRVTLFCCSAGMTADGRTFSFFACTCHSPRLTLPVKLDSCQLPRNQVSILWRAAILLAGLARTHTQNTVQDRTLTKVTTAWNMSPIP